MEKLVQLPLNSNHVRGAQIAARKVEHARGLMAAFGRPMAALEVMTHEDFVAAVKRNDLDGLYIDPCRRCRNRGICDSAECAMYGYTLDLNVSPILDF